MPLRAGKMEVEGGALPYRIILRWPGRNIFVRGCVAAVTAGGGVRVGRLTNNAESRRICCPHLPATLEFCATDTGFAPILRPNFRGSMAPRDLAWVRRIECIRNLSG